MLDAAGWVRGSLRRFLRPGAALGRPAGSFEAHRGVDDAAVLLHGDRRQGRRRSVTHSHSNSFKWKKGKTTQNKRVTMNHRGGMFPLWHSPTCRWSVTHTALPHAWLQTHTETIKFKKISQHIYHFLFGCLLSSFCGFSCFLVVMVVLGGQLAHLAVLPWVCRRSNPRLRW